LFQFFQKRGFDVFGCDIQGGRCLPSASIQFPSGSRLVYPRLTTKIQAARNPHIIALGMQLMIFGNLTSLTAYLYFFQKTV
jgi:hypothetical protein